MAKPNSFFAIGSESSAHLSYVVSEERHDVLEGFCVQYLICSSSELQNAVRISIHGRPQPNYHYNSCCSILIIPLSTLKLKNEEKESSSSRKYYYYSELSV